MNLRGHVFLVENIYVPLTVYFATIVFDLVPKRINSDIMSERTHRLGDRAYSCSDYLDQRN